VSAPADYGAPLLVLGVLRATFPASLGAFLPLERGIHTKLSAALPELPRKHLRKALAYHARSPRYLRAVAAAGAIRVDLDGRPVEPVSDVDREHAAQKVSAIRKRKAERKQAA
jgi:sRNA-binding protein